MSNFPDHVVMYVDTVDEAIEKIETCDNIDMLLLDSFGGDGLKIAKIAREKDCSMIILSISSRNGEYRRSLSKIGIDGFVTKPFDLYTIITCLNNAMVRMMQLQELQRYREQHEKLRSSLSELLREVNQKINENMVKNGKVESRSGGKKRSGRTESGRAGKLKRAVNDFVRATAII